MNDIRITNQPGASVLSTGALATINITSLAQLNERFPRLYGAECALSQGYTIEHLAETMLRFENFETHLVGLFGENVRNIFMDSICFATDNSGTQSSVIGLSQGRDLSINPALVSPQELLDRLDIYLPHEYGHALTFNRNILWDSLPEREKEEFRRYSKWRDTGTQYMEDGIALLAFFNGLEIGINNPFIGGLCFTEARNLTKYAKLHEYGYRTNDLDTAADDITKYTIELLTEAIANLIGIRSVKEQAVQRDLQRVFLQSAKEMFKSQNGYLTFAAIAYITVFAEKTGNSDLLDIIKGIDSITFPNEPDIKYAQAYKEACEVFRRLWENITILH